MKLLRTNSSRSKFTTITAPPPLLRNTSASSTSSEDTLGSDPATVSVLKKDTRKRRFRKNATKPTKSVQFATDNLIQVHNMPESSDNDNNDDIWWTAPEMARMKEERRQVVEQLSNRKECCSLLHKIYDNKGNVAKHVQKLHESLHDIRGLETRVLAFEDGCYKAQCILHRFKVLEVAAEVYEFGIDATTSADLECIRYTSLQSSAKLTRVARYF